MTPSAPGSIRELNAGTREAAAVLPAGGLRTRPATQAKPTENAREFRDVLRRQRGPEREAEPRPERRSDSPVGAQADGVASQPAAPNAKASEKPAQEPPDAAQDSDDAGAVSAEADDSASASIDADGLDVNDHPSQGRRGEEAGISAQSTTDSLPQDADATASRSVETAPRVAAGAEPAPAQTPRQPAAHAHKSGAAPTGATGTQTAPSPSTESEAPVKVIAETPPESPTTVAGAKNAGAPVGANRQVQANVAAEPQRVAEAAVAPKPSPSVTAPTEPAAESRVQEGAPPPTETRAESQRQSAPSRSEASSPEFGRSNPVPGRSIFVVEPDSVSREVRPSAAVAPVVVKSEPTSAPTQQAAAPGAQGTGSAAAVQESGAAAGSDDSADFGSSGDRRNSSSQREGSAPATEGGAQKDSQPTIGADLGVKPGPTLGGASATAPKPAQSMPTEAQVVAQSVARGLNAAVNQRGGSITLRLAPESLGLVRIQMTLDQGAVSVRLEATNPAAQGLLTEHIAMLRGSLESRGLTVDKLTVQYAPTTSVAGAAFSHGSGGAGQNPAGANQQQASQSGDQQGLWQDAAGGESRGRRDADQEGNPGRPSNGFDDGEPGTARGGADAERFGGRLRLRLEAVA